MWEHRYNALKPTRSGGNTRYYDNSQLRRLLNIVSLTKFDYRISDLCSMTDKMLFKLVEDFNKEEIANEPIEYFVSQIIAAGMSYDEPHFEKIFSHCVLRFGVKTTYVKVIYPVLLRIGLMWASDAMQPAYEHYISNLLRQKLFTAIDSIAPPKVNSETWLLFLPENEFHEIGLLIANYIIRFSGRNVIYLGGNVPWESLLTSIDDTRPGNLLFFLVHNDLPGDAQKYCSRLSAAFKGKKIFIAGNPKLISQLKADRKIRWLQSVESLEELLGMHV
jgi:MerR family transcriptional regulator, light-induced transcriptional regulator